MARLTGGFFVSRRRRCFLGMAKFKPIFIGALAIAGGVASLAIHRQAQINVSQNETVLRRQDNQQAEFAAERQRLSSLLARAESSSAAEDRTAELVKLRAQVETLRKQTNELAKQRVKDRRWRPSQSDSSPAPGESASVARHVVSDSDSEEYKIQLYRLASAAPHSPPLTNDHTTRDARNLRSALYKYAREHQSELPSGFDRAAAYYYPDEPLPRTDEFEIVYQGSLN